MKELSKNTSTLLFILLTGVLVVIAFISYNKIRQFNKSVDLVMDTQIVKENIIELRSIVKDAESGQRGYLITNDSVFLQPVIGAEQRSNLVLAKYDSLISDNVGQKENLKKLKTLLAERYLLLNKTLASFKNNPSANLPTDSLLLESTNKMDEVRKQIALMLQTEDKLLEQRIQVKDRKATLTPIFLLLLSLFSIVALTLFFFRLQKETNSRVSIAKLVEVEAEARKQIEASELFNRTVLESSPDCLKVLDNEGRIQYMNFNGLCQMEIDDFSTFKNKNWWTIWGSENEALVKASLDKAITGKIAQFIAYCPTAKGTPKWWDVLVSPVGKAGEPVQQIISVSRDITEQKKSEEAIEKIASHLKLATDSANVGTWSFNVQKQELEWSAVHKRMWGYDEHRTDLIYEDWHKLILPEDKEKTFEKIDEAKNNHNSYDVEYCINRANDDAVRCIRSVGKYYYNEKGEAETLTGISIDITEQNQIEETLSYRQALLEAHNEANRDGLLLVDAKGKIISYNQSFIDVWRMPKEIVDSKDDELALEFAMAQLVNPQQFIDKVKWLYEHPSETSIDELEYIDGRIIERHGYSVIGEDGTYYAWSWTFRDITEQKAAAEAIKESETRFRTMAEATEVLIGVADEASNVTYFNKAWVDFTGRPMEDLLKLGWADLLHPEDKDRVVDTYFSAFANQEGYELEFRILNKNGEYSWLLAKVPARFHPDGTFAGYISASIDITDRKEAEEKIKDARELLETTFQNVPSAIYNFDKTGKILYLNEIGANQIGYATAEEVLAEKDVFQLRKRAYETFTVLNEQGEPMPVDQNSTALTFKTGESSEVVSQLINKKTGASLWLLSRATPIYDDNDQLIKVLSTSTDITLQKAAAEAIKVSEVKFRVLSETIPNMIWTAQPDGKRNFFNQYMLDYTGKTSNELYGDGWHQMIAPLDLERTLKHWHHSIETGEDYTNENRWRHRDGSYQWFLAHAIAQKDEEGNVVGWIGSCTDITEQKAFTEELEIKVKERTYQLHLQNETFKIAEKIAKFGSYKWNLKTDSLEYSDNLFRLFDCKPNEFIPSIEKFLSFIHPDDLQQVTKNGEETKETGKLAEIPYRIISKTGKIKHLRSSVSFTGGDNNSILIGTVQDISKDVEAAMKLRAKNIELENSNAELASFSYVASHDLKEPLRKIRTFSNLIIETENFSEKTQDYFNRMTSAAERMQNLIDSLLDFSRVNQSEMVFEPCDLNLLVEVSKDDLQIKISEKQVTIEYDNLPVIMGVCIQISQLITNLLENAIKYSRPEVKPLIRITALIIEGKKIDHPSANKKTKYHAIQFADNGIGFEQEYEKKIFGLFQRLHGNDEYSGTGIGLGIVKKIVTYHDGFIVAEGQPNIGATFKIYIPIT